MVERLRAQSLELTPVTSNLGRLLLVRVSRKTFKIYNIQMGGFRPGNPMVHLCVYALELQ